MSKLDKIVEDLSSLTVLEAADLAKLLEEKWGVSAAAPVAAAAPAAPATAIVGVPTGEFVNGVAVHRLPSITVTASRSEELANSLRSAGQILLADHTGNQAVEVLAGAGFEVFLASSDIAESLAQISAVRVQ